MPGEGEGQRKGQSPRADSEWEMLGSWTGTEQKVKRDLGRVQHETPFKGVRRYVPLAGLPASVPAANWASGLGHRVRIFWASPKLHLQHLHAPATCCSSWTLTLSRQMAHSSGVSLKTASCMYTFGCPCVKWMPFPPSILPCIADYQHSLFLDGRELLTSSHWTRYRLA